MNSSKTIPVFETVSGHHSNLSKINSAPLLMKIEIYKDNATFYLRPVTRYSLVESGDQTKTYTTHKHKSNQKLLIESMVFLTQFEFVYIGVNVPND